MICYFQNWLLGTVSLFSRRTSSENPDDLGKTSRPHESQGETHSALDVMYQEEEKALDIIQAFGLATSERWDLVQTETNARKQIFRMHAAPQSLLKNSVAEIREACMLALLIAELEGCERLLSCYGDLAHYIPDGEYEAALESIQGRSLSPLALEVFNQSRAREVLFWEELDEHFASYPADLPRVAYLREQVAIVLKIMRQARSDDE